jgi:hypothetical protein
MKPVKALGKSSIAALLRGGLGIAWLLLWIVAGLCVLTAVGYAIAMIMAATGALDPAVLHEKSQHIRLNNGTVENYQGPDWLLVYATLIVASTGTAGALIIVWRLRKLFDSFMSGEPFRRENANHLRVIWITMLVVEVTRIALFAVISVLIHLVGGPHVEGHGAATTNLSTWAAILILIVLAEVFREGARLKEEQELTI